MIKLITFDLDNTLWDVNPVIKNAEAQLRQWLGTHYPDVLAVYASEFAQATFDALVQQNPALGQQPTRARKAVFLRCFEEAGCAKAEAQCGTEAAFHIFWQARNTIDLYPETIPVLTQLAAAYPLIAISNGNADIHVLGLGHFFCGHYSADASGAPKPDPTMFNAALRQQGISAEQAVHIGDNPQDDINAAQQVGYKTIWYRDNTTYAIDSCQPSAVVNRLSDLPHTIESLANAQNPITD